MQVKLCLKFIVVLSCCILIRFGARVEMLHCLEKPFSAASGGFILQNLMFDQARTNFTEVCGH